MAGHIAWLGVGIVTAINITLVKKSLVHVVLVPLQVEAVRRRVLAVLAGEHLWTGFFCFDGGTDNICNLKLFLLLLFSFLLLKQSMFSPLMPFKSSHLRGFKVTSMTTEYFLFQFDFRKVGLVGVN